jgi:ATP-dependent RNA helicase DDX21
VRAFTQTRFVVLDEADLMLSMGFSEDVEIILESVPEERQTLLFSATMPSWVKNITKRFLKEPALVDLVGEAQSGKMPDSIKCACAPLPPTLSAHDTPSLLPGPESCTSRHAG